MPPVPYSFSVLRYVPDPVTQEFLNIGVVLFSPAAGFLRAFCTPDCRRIHRTFQHVDADAFLRLTRHIEERVGALGAELECPGIFEPNGSIETAVARVLPPDDSAFQFQRCGVGMSADLDQTLRQLYHRYVNQSTEPVEEISV